MQARRQTSLEPLKPKISTTCTACRVRHLKCSGPPICTRCRTDGNSCTFVESRRGKRTPATRRMEHPTPLALTPSTGQATERSYLARIQVGLWNRPHQISEWAPDSTLPGPFDYSPPSASNAFRPISNSQAYPALPATGYTASTDLTAPETPHVHLLNLYYQYFHSNHPFLLPRQHLDDWLSKDKLAHLQAAISYIGASYDNNFNSQRSSLRVAIDFTIFVQHPPRDGFLVQTLLLYAIGLHGNDERSRASQILNMAIDLALELTMNHKDFARNNNRGSRVVEESWRRTWWELYYIDGTFAVADGRDQFRSSSIQIDCLLPCEEEEYSSGHIPLPQSIESYDNRFCALPPTFASYTYRIDSMRIIATILPFSSGQASRTNHLLDISDAQIVNWFLSLPEEKTKFIRGDGSCDHLLIQACMTIYLGVILLHLSHSSVLSSTASQPSIDPIFPQDLTAPPPIDPSTAKCLHAADNMALLTKLPVTTPQFTPIFVHALLKSLPVHLSAYPVFPAAQLNIFPSPPGTNANIYFAPPLQSSRLPSHLTLSPPTPVPIPTRQQLEQRMKLQVGTLKSLTITWPIAASAVEDLKISARHIVPRLRQAQRSMQPDFDERSIDRFLEVDCPARDLERWDFSGSMTGVAPLGHPMRNSENEMYLNRMWRGP